MGQSELNLSDLVLWIERLVSDDQRDLGSSNVSSHKVELAAITRLHAIVLQTAAPQETLNDVRLLIASGVLRWRPPSQENQTCPQTLVYSLASAALWPLVLVAKLPPLWESALQQITSREIVGLVVSTRMSRASLGLEQSALRLVQELPKSSFREGIERLFEDLRDPQRGGAALTAIITIRDGTSPEKVENIPSLLRLIIAGATGAAAQGIVGNRADALVLEAWKYFMKMLDTDGNASTYKIQGDKFIEEGDYEKAISEYNKAISLSSNQSDYYYKRGISYLRIGDYDRVIANLNMAINLDKNNAYYYDARAIAYYYLGNYDKGIEDQTMAISIDNSVAGFYTQRGDNYRVKGDYNRAVIDYNEATNIDKLNLDAYCGRGYTYLLKGDYNFALNEFNKAIDIDSNFARSYNGRGKVYYAMSDYDRAISEFNKAIALDKDGNIDYYYYNRALAYEYVDKRKAIADLRRCLNVCKHPILRREAESELRKLGG